jgi:biopolymer transport protein ExbD
MAFTATRDASDTMSDMNITPLVDVMLVLLVIFMVTAPMMDLRIGMGLSQTNPQPPPPRVERELTVEPGDLFRLDGVTMTPAAMETALAEWRRATPDAVLKLAVSPDADYQSAATAMATARRAGVENIGLVEP